MSYRIFKPWDNNIVTDYSLFLVEAGIGPTTAALCAIDLAKCLGPKFKELIYTGTSGWSAAVGGILNADSCEKATSTHKVSFEYYRHGFLCPVSIPTGALSIIFKRFYSFIVRISALLFHG